MTTLTWMCVGLAGIGALYQFIQLAAASRFFRRARKRWDAPGTHTPPVTILKPLKGSGIELYENLETFCRLDYPSYEILFGVADPDDPAVAIVERLRAAHPDVDMTLVTGHRAGTNAKVGSLLNMLPKAKHDVYVLSDADIRVRPDYLRTLVNPLQHPAVGLTTCLYRGIGHFGAPTVLESMLINADFIPMALIGEWFGIKNAYGASIALRKDSLDAMGGFEAIRNHLADDYLLGKRIAAAGYQLVTLPYVVETVLDSRTLGDVWRHQLRWARTYRACEPIGWAAAVFTQATFWGVMAVIVTGGSTLGWAALGAVTAARFGTLLVIMRLLREPETPRHLGLVPLKDVFSSAVWFATWIGREVEWSGRRFRVDPDGRLIPTDLPELIPGTADPQES